MYTHPATRCLRLVGCLLALGLVAALPAGAESPALHSSVDVVIDYATTSCNWSPWIKESAGVAYECPGGTVLGGMKHSGDENGDTSYLCCALTPQPVKKSACEWSNPIRESNSNYDCPAWQAMSGRKHSGDENGQTQYYCCDLENPSGQMWTDDVSCRWVGPQKQSSSNLECSGGQVVIGRNHEGDENGDTSIYCCSFQGND